MQETPEFTDIKTRFGSFSAEEILQTDPPINEPSHVFVVNRAFDYLRSYFAEDNFRGTLTLQRKRAIENQINNVLAQFDDVRRFRNEGQLQPNLDNIIINIQNFLEEIDSKFITPLSIFTLSSRRNIASIVSNIERTEESVNRISGQLTDTLNKANLLVGEAAGAELYAHFLKLANGKSVKENDDSGGVKIPWWLPFLISFGIATILLIVILVNQGSLRGYFSSPKSNHVDAHIKFLAFSVFSFFLIVPFIYSWLNTTRPAGHERAAMVWALAGVFFTVITGGYALVLLHNLGGSPGWNELVPKIVTLLAPAYLVRLCIQNYKANKHLAVLNTHRATVARIVGGFAKNLQRAEPELQTVSLSAQAAIYEKAAELIFDPGETGFISRKEGAGSSDNFFDGMPKIQ